MRTADMASLLEEHDQRVFTTGDFAILSGTSVALASQHLRRMTASGLVTRIKRAVWINRLARGINPCEAVPYLRAPWPAYVSLHSALSEHGVIEEIPQVTYAVTPALPWRYRTPLGAFHYHHLPNRLIWGYSVRRSGSASYPMADPEKAFLDLVYLALIPRSPLGFPRKREKAWNLDTAKLMRYAGRFKYPPLLEYVRKMR